MKSGCKGLMGGGRERLGSGRLGILKSLSLPLLSAIVGCEKLQKPFSSQVSQVISVTRSWASRPPVVDSSWCWAFHLSHAFQAVEMGE